MALQKTYTKTVEGFEGSLTVENAYWKVTAISGDKDEIRCEICAISNGSAIATRSYAFTPDLSGANFIQQAYNHIKNQDEFAGAADV